METDQVGQWSSTNQANNSSSPSSLQSSYNSSYGSNSGQKLLNSSSSSIPQVPGGVVTTQNISTVIRPKDNNNSLQFVKIQTPELSKKAVEQIKLAEETKISKSKIKEVEEEWQHNLLEWKSKRRQQFPHLPNASSESNNDSFADAAGGRKIKTFAEMIKERSESGRNRLGFNLQRYIGAEDDNIVDEIQREQHYDQANYTDASTCDEPCFNDQLDIDDITDNNKVASDDMSQDKPANGNSSTSLIDRAACGDSSSQEPDVCDDINHNKHISRDVIDNNGHQSVAFDKNFNIPDDHKLKTDMSEQSIEKKFGQYPSQIVRSGQRDLDAEVASISIDDEIKQPEEKFEGYDDDYEDVDDEEDHEEQLHLQRVAFEAKLKAFERLTKTKIEPAPPVPFRKEPGSVQTHKSGSKPIVRPATNSVHQVDGNKWQMSNPSHEDHQPQKHIPPVNHQRKIVSPPQPPPIPTQQVGLNHPPSLTNIDQKQFAPLIAKTLTPLPELSRQTSMLNDHQKLPSTTRLEHQPQPILPTELTKRLISSTDLYRPQKPLSNSNQFERGPSSQNLVQSQQEIQNYLQQPVPPPAQNLRLTPAPNHQSRVPIPPNAQDDKDKTVLSVSGKKRCSSCKEELGRGAAAFVVESLSLVYHTNCFRCSVCHINLSNGFRGVDVRVHAGALHCQNCYSKDGLNYSRV